MIREIIFVAIIAFIVLFLLWFADYKDRKELEDYQHVNITSPAKDIVWRSLDSRNANMLKVNNDI